MHADRSANPLWLSNSNTSLFMQRARADLQVALQPIVDINTGQTVAFESLVRGADKLGFASIDALFDHAAASDTLCQLEVSLIGLAMQAVASLRSQYRSLLFVNLDGRTLRQRKLLQSALDGLVRDIKLDPSAICIELSERNQVLSASQLADEVAALRKGGYLVAIDDFGTGQSGLQMLYQSNPNFLKVDRFFVQAMEGDNKKKLLVSTIVDLAHTMGIRVIAEGVESIPELHASRDVRCDLAQGYLIERPTVIHQDLKSVYSVVSSNPNRRGKGYRDFGIRDALQSLRTLSIDASLVDVFELFKSCPDQMIIPIIDKLGIPHGVVRERDLKPFVYSRYGRDLLSNTSVGVGLKDFVRSVPIADINAQLEPLLDLVSDASADGILITDGLKYAGVVPAASLTRLANEMRLEAAIDKNPLTRLPANTSIKEFIDRAVSETQVKRVFCHADLDNFKPFNDCYGFRAGDRALLLFSDLLKLLRLSSDVLVGHVGGDDFFVGATGEAAEDLLERLKNIIEQFRSDAANLYTKEDRDAGYIVSKDRLGIEQRFPLLSCTVAALEIPASLSIPSTDLVTDTLAEVKAVAKRSKGALLAMSIDCNQPDKVGEACAA